MRAQTIERYLKQLEKELNDLPENQRTQHLAEYQSHLEAAYKDWLVENESGKPTLELENVFVRTLESPKTMAAIFRGERIPEEASQWEIVLSSLRSVVLACFQSRFLNFHYPPLIYGLLFPILSVLVGFALWFLLPPLMLVSVDHGPWFVTTSIASIDGGPHVLDAVLLKGILWVFLIACVIFLLGAWVGQRKGIKFGILVEVEFCVLLSGGLSLLVSYNGITQVVPMFDIYCSNWQTIFPFPSPATLFGWAVFSFLYVAGIISIMFLGGVLSAIIINQLIVKSIRRFISFRSPQRVLRVFGILFLLTSLVFTINPALVNSSSAFEDYNYSRMEIFSPNTGLLYYDFQYSNKTGWDPQQGLILTEGNRSEFIANISYLGNIPVLYDGLLKLQIDLEHQPIYTASGWFEYTYQDETDPLTAFKGELFNLSSFFLMPDSFSQDQPDWITARSNLEIIDGFHLDNNSVQTKVKDPFSTDYADFYEENHTNNMGEWVWLQFDLASGTLYQAKFFGSENVTGIMRFNYLVINRVFRMIPPDTGQYWLVFFINTILILSVLGGVTIFLLFAGRKWR